MKNIIINIGSDLFDGFYESIHCNSDEFIDVEMEDKDIQKYEENEITALLDMLLLLSNQENGK